MSLQLNWVTDEFAIPAGKRPWSNGSYVSCLTHLEDGLGYETVVSGTVIIDGSAGSTPAYRFKVKGTNGEFMSRDVVDWGDAGFNLHYWDPSQEGMYWSKDIYHEVTAFAPDTWTEVTPAYEMFVSDWRDENGDDIGIYLVDFMGMIYDRNIVFGRDNTLKHDRIAMYDLISRRRKGWFKTGVSDDNDDKVFPMTQNDGYAITSGGILTPIIFEDRATPSLSLRVGEEVPYAGRSFSIDPVTHSLNVFVVGPDYDYGRSDARIYNYSLRSSPRHVVEPFALRMPRSNRNQEVVSMLMSDDGRLSSNWPYTVSEVGDGSVTDKSPTNSTNSNGLARMELDTTATGGYSQQVTVTAEHGEVVA